MATLDDENFRFSPDALAELISSKDLIKFEALGGLVGLTSGLSTDYLAGLSINECLHQESTQQSVMRHALPNVQNGSTPLRSRSAVFGTNRLPERESMGLFQLMKDAFNDKVLVILSVVAAVSLLAGLYQSLAQPHTPGKPRLEWVEGLTIMVAVAIVVVASALNDWQKERQFTRLSRKKSDRTVKAIRSGKALELSVYDILVGDVLYVEPGDVIPADGVLISGHSIRADESSVTGETDQITKNGTDVDLEHARSESGSDAFDPFLISGSKILEGIGTYLVIAVGPHSMHGKLQMAVSEKPEPTPLQTKLSGLADKLAKGGIAIALLLFFTLTVQFLWRIPGSKETAFENLQTFLRLFTVSLAVVACAVPEGLPLAVTLALAIAITRMLRDNNLVRTLSACETMGSATTVCCDKTGTLTMNKMTVVAGMIGLARKSKHFPNFTNGNGTKSSSERLGASSSVKFNNGMEEVMVGTCRFRLSKEIREILVESIAVNSTAFEGEEDGNTTFIGSKTETALLSFARDQLHMGPLSEERASAVTVEVFPFSSSRKSMASVVKMSNGTHRLYVKGAPELLLEKSTRILADTTHMIERVELTEQQRQSVIRKVDTYGRRSLRTLGLAYRDFDHWPLCDGETDQHEGDRLHYILHDLTFLGVLGIRDPLRPGVADSVAACKHAGVFVRMVTGDNITTAKAIATECGILTQSGVVMEGPEFRKLTSPELDMVVPRLQVLARSTPEDKAVLVKKLKNLGEAVAATGDGTNDVLALRAADVGFSMGLSGTEIAKEASDIVLLDDDFGSLVKAIKWGRSVNDIIKKFLQFQLTANITTMILTFASAVTNSKEESVLTPVQLLWINLIMDTFAALALATDSPDPSVLDKMPEDRSAPLISFSSWKIIIGQSTYQLVVTLALNFGASRVLRYATLEDQKALNTLIFNSFVWMQLFNLYNCRCLDNRLNVFHGVLQNWYFIAVNLVIIVGQILIIFFGGGALSVVRLSALQWAISLSLGVLSIPIGMLIRLIPDEMIRSIFMIEERKQRLMRFPYDNTASTWNDCIEQVRSGLRDWNTPPKSFLRQVRHKVEDVVHLAVVFDTVFGTSASTEDQDDERHPLLQHHVVSTLSGQHKDRGLLSSAVVMVGIVAGGITPVSSSREE